MALTPAQKKWAVGGSIAAVALAVGYGLSHRRLAHAGLLPAGRPHGEHEHHRGHRHDEARDERELAATREDARGENERGEYGQRKKHHHRHKHD